jgi:hypothetical protein
VLLRSPLDLVRPRQRLVAVALALTRTPVRGSSRVRGWRGCGAEVEAPGR